MSFGTGVFLLVGIATGALHELSGWNVENRSGIRQNSFYRNGISGEIHYTPNRGTLTTS